VAAPTKYPDELRALRPKLVGLSLNTSIHEIWEGIRVGRKRVERLIVAFSHPVC
jgi:hypothetical protein